MEDKSNNELNNENNELQEIDLSSAALSRTMIDIRKVAEVINNAGSDMALINENFLKIESLIETHAKFSDRLQNLQVRILDKTIEVVRNLDELKAYRLNYIRNYFINQVNKILAANSVGNIEKRRNNYDIAQKHILKGLDVLNDDPVLNAYLQMLIEEYDSIDQKIKQKQEKILLLNKNRWQ